MTSTYNEPLITSEWAVAVFRQARAAGLLCSYVSNGNATEEVLEYLRPLVSLYKVDLKSFRDRRYRELGGTLERVTWTIRALHEKGFWVEVVTLVVPGFNDSPEELREIARFLASVSPDIPWHVTAFHPDYKMEDRTATPVRTLVGAVEIGPRGRAALRLRGQPARCRPWPREHLLPVLPGAARRAPGLPCAAERARRRRPLPGLPHGDPGRLGLNGDTKGLAPTGTRPSYADRTSR